MRRLAASGHRGYSPSEAKQRSPIFGGEFKIIAAVTETPVIGRVPAHLGLAARAHIATGADAAA